MTLSAEVLDRDIEFFHRALNIAQFSDHRVRVGCVAAQNRKILAGAFNTIRNDPKNVAFRDATRHAERNVCSLVSDRDVRRITFYIARIGQDGVALPSRPCYVCFNHLSSLGVREIVYWNGTEVFKERL